ncbi:hypothetical protein ACFLWU_04145 [Chloroflexota bacterium]
MECNGYALDVAHSSSLGYSDNLDSGSGNLCYSHTRLYHERISPTPIRRGSP